MKSFSDRFLAFSLSLVFAVSMLSVPLLTGCNSSQALLEVQRFEPVVINVLVLACTINASLPVCGSGQAKIKTDANLVIKLWSDYNAALKSGTSTVAAWNALNAAFAVFEQDSAEIFSLGLGLNAPEVTAIVASAQVLLASIEAFFPGPPPAANAQKPDKFARYGSPAAASYNKAWFEAWARDYNAKVDAAKNSHRGAKLEKVHVHSTGVRLLTLGWER